MKSLSFFLAFVVVLSFSVTMGEEMGEDCRQIVALHQKWLNETQNYVHDDKVLSKEEEIVGESQNLVDYHEGKRYSYSKDFRKGTSSFVTASVWGGGATIKVQEVGSADMFASGSAHLKSSAKSRGYGDGTTGVFLHGDSAEITVQRFETIAEQFECVVGTNQWDGLVGFQFRHTSQYKDGAKKSVKNINLGTSEAVESAERLVDALGRIIMWYDKSTGELRGVELFTNGKNAADQHLFAAVVIKTTERNLDEAMLQQVKSKLTAPSSMDSLPHFTNLEQLSDEMIQRNIQRRERDIPWMTLVITGIALILVLVLLRRRRSKISGRDSR
jgi:hypothetical protein